MQMYQWFHLDNALLLGFEHSVALVIFDFDA